MEVLLLKFSAKVPDFEKSLEHECAINRKWQTDITEFKPPLPLTRLKESEKQSYF